jgi:hypothetical protein
MMSFDDNISRGVVIAVIDLDCHNIRTSFNLVVGIQLQPSVILLR